MFQNTLNPPSAKSPSQMTFFVQTKYNNELPLQPMNNERNHFDSCFPFLKRPLEAFESIYI